MESYVSQSEVCLDSSLAALEEKDEDRLNASLDYEPNQTERDLNGRAGSLYAHAIVYSQKKERLYDSQFWDSKDGITDDKKKDLLVSHEIYLKNNELYKKYITLLFKLLERQKKIDISKFSHFPLLNLAVFYGDAEAVKLLAPLVHKEALVSAWYNVYHFANIDITTIKAPCKRHPHQPDIAIIDALLLNEPNFSSTSLSYLSRHVFIDMLDKLQEKADDYVNVFLRALPALAKAELLGTGLLLAAKYNIPRLFSALLRHGVELNRDVIPPENDLYGEIASIIKCHKNTAQLITFIHQLMCLLSTLPTTTAMFSFKAKNIPLRDSFMIKLITVNDMLYLQPRSQNRFTDLFNEANKMLLLALSEFYLNLKKSGSKRYMEALTNFMSKKDGCIMRFQVPETAQGLETCIAKLTENGWSCFDEVFENYQQITKYDQGYNDKVCSEMIDEARKAIAESQKTITLQFFKSSPGDMKQIEPSRTAGSSSANLTESKRSNEVTVTGKVSQNTPAKLTNVADRVLFKQFLLSRIDDYSNPYAEIKLIIQAINDKKTLLLHHMLLDCSHDVTKSILAGNYRHAPEIVNALKTAISQSGEILKDFEKWQGIKKWLPNSLNDNSNTPSNKAGFTKSG